MELLPSNGGLPLRTVLLLLSSSGVPLLLTVLPLLVLMAALPLLPMALLLLLRAMVPLRAAMVPLRAAMAPLRAMAAMVGRLREVTVPPLPRRLAATTRPPTGALLLGRLPRSAPRRPGRTPSRRT